MRDCLWVWGHCAGAHNDIYNLPGRSVITPADAVRELGLHRLFHVRYGKQPVSPFAPIVSDLREFEVVWSLIGAGGRTNLEEREEILELVNDYEHVTGLIFDDFWSGGPEENGKVVLSIEQFRELRTRCKKDFWSVCYVSELFKPDIQPYLDGFDKHTLWTWDPYHLNTVQDKLERFRKMVPNKPRYMGVYLWDYGRCEPVPLPLLQKQCQAGLEWMKAGELQGMIFLASCLIDLPIDAVKWVKSWIKENGDEALDHCWR